MTVRDRHDVGNAGDLVVADVVVVVRMLEPSVVVGRVDSPERALGDEPMDVGFADVDARPVPLPVHPAAQRSQCALPSSVVLRQREVRAERGKDLGVVAEIDRNVIDEFAPRGQAQIGRHAATDKEDQLACLVGVQQVGIHEAFLSEGERTCSRQQALKRQKPGRSGR